MSIFNPAYQNYANENYDPDDSPASADKEIAEMQKEYERHQSIENCSQCSAEIKIYVGQDSEALDWEEYIREPKDARERELFELDPLSFYDRKYFIKAEYLICADCKAKQPVSPSDDGIDNIDDILF